MKLTAAAILVSRGMKILKAAPAAYPYRQAVGQQGSHTMAKLCLPIALVVLVCCGFYFRRSPHPEAEIRNHREADRSAVDSIPHSSAPSLSAHTEDPHFAIANDADWTDEEWDDVAAVTDCILYEGLPHQLYEADLLAVERRRNDTIELGGYPFYGKRLGLSADDKKVLLKTLSNSLLPHTGEKKCGGFHPDYALSLSVRGDHVDLVVQVCFGCGELRVFREKEEKLYDLTNHDIGRIRTVLAAYATNRPMPDSSK